MKYVCNNFMATLEDGLDIDVADGRLRHWTAEVAGKRVHGTTHRRPLDVFEAEERAALLPLPARPYVPVVWRKARVHTDSHVIFDKRLYSVHYRFLHKDAWVRATPDTVDVYVDDERVATHARRGPSLRSTDDDHLPAARVAFRHRGQDFWTRRAALLGEHVEGLVHEIFALESVLNPLRAVQAIVTLLERHPKERANNAAKRAQHFGTRTYKGVAEILRTALDFEPLPPELPLPNPAQPALRARRRADAHLETGEPPRTATPAPARRRRRSGSAWPSQRRARDLPRSRGRIGSAWPSQVWLSLAGLRVAQLGQALTRAARPASPARRSVGRLEAC